jgi:hypothetical protein
MMFANDDIPNLKGEANPYYNSYLSQNNFEEEEPAKKPKK